MLINERSCIVDLIVNGKEEILERMEFTLGSLGMDSITVYRGGLPSFLCGRIDRRVCTLWSLTLCDIRD